MRLLCSVKQLKIELIKENPNNPRVIKDEKFKQLVKSIKEFPRMLELRPLVIDENNMVLGGNMRLKACKELGMKMVPVMMASDLSEEQKKEFIIKDNVGFGEMDWDLIANEWDIASITDWGLDLPVSFNSIDKAEEDNYKIVLPANPKTKIGDIYQIGKHRLMCGDSTIIKDFEKLMEGNQSEMVFTDPPWNVNYGDVKEDNPMGYKPRTIMNDSMPTEDFKKFMSDVFKNISIVSKKGSPVYIVMSAQEWGNLMLTLNENGYHWSSTVIWNKSHHVMSRKDYHTKYEPIWYGWIDGAPRICPVQDRKQSDVWDIPRPTKSELHPTTKPIELISIAIKNSSYKEAIVLDCFGGSGSTMVTCDQLERVCYSMELDPKYCDVIVDRMIALNPNIEILKNGKKYQP